MIEVSLYNSLILSCRLVPLTIYLPNFFLVTRFQSINALFAIPILVLVLGPEHTTKMRGTLVLVPSEIWKGTFFNRACHLIPYVPRQAQKLSITAHFNFSCCFMQAIGSTRAAEVSLTLNVPSLSIVLKCCSISSSDIFFISAPTTGLGSVAFLVTAAFLVVATAFLVDTAFLVVFLFAVGAVFFVVVKQS